MTSLRTRLMIVLLLLLAFGAAPAWPQAQPAPIPAQGAWVHPASGMTFPAAVAGFQRVSLYRFDAGGLDVSAGYNLVTPQGAVVVTVYVYPAPPLSAGASAQARAAACRDEFELRRQEVFGVHTGVQMIRSEPAPARGGEPVEGLMGAFEFYTEFFGERQPVHSELYIYCHVGGAWLVKYRVTHPRAFNAAPHITAFLNELQWTIKP